MSNWIPTSERLPTREETNGHETVWAVDEHGTHWTWNYVMSPISRFAHPPIAWHAFPRYTPPKPGPTDEECAELLEREAGIGARIAEPTKHWNDEAFALWNLSVRRWFDEVTARIEKEKRK